MSFSSEENLIPPILTETKQEEEAKQQSIGAGTTITSTNHDDDKDTNSLNESLAPTEVDTSKEAKDVVISPPPPPPPPPTPTLEGDQPHKPHTKFDSTSKKDALPDKSSSSRLYASNSLPFLDAINLKKILSTRPSTPYTQAMPLTAVRFDLESVAEHANAAKKDDYHGRRSTRDALGNDKSKNYLTWSSQSVPSLPILRGYHDRIKEKSKSLINTPNGSILQYSRSTLLAIGKELNQLKNRQIRRSASQQFRTMANCNEIEIEALLKRFYIWKNPAAPKNASTNAINTKSFNDMTADTSNLKIVDGSIIRSEPPQSAEYKDSRVVKNQKYFGSGRLRSSIYSFQNSSSRKGFKKYDEQLENRENIFGDRSNATRNGTIFNDTNYVKPVLSGFLVVSRSKGQESEEKYERQYTNPNDEPEWFSCGPTSRLDTIELTGFEEDEERPLRLRNGNGEMNKENGGDTEKDKPRYEAKPLSTHHGFDKFQNRNHANIINNYDVTEGHSERSKKKSFHYDQFSRQRSRGHFQSNDMKNGHQYQNSSKFLPFFSCFNKKTSEQLEPMYSFESIDDFFKKVVPPQKKAEPLHPINVMESKNGLKPGPSKRLNINPKEIPLVDDLETKWRQGSSIRGKSADVINKCDTNNNNSTSNSNSKSDRDSENFQNLIKQLYGCGQKNQFDNFTNIKLHQQSGLNQLFAHESFLLAQQGHYQAAAAALGNLQLKSILSRPESQALLLGLIKGDISKHGLWLQLTNPHLPHRDREAITAILTFINTQQYQHLAQFSQTNFGLLPNNLIINQLQNLQNLAQIQQTMVPQQQQQQQQGSKKYTHVTPPVVSHEELQTHANWIMQNALIKQRIKEQGNAVNLQKLWQLNASTKQQPQHLQHLGRNLNSRLSTASLQNAPPSERRRTSASNHSRGFDMSKPRQGGKELKENFNECHSMNNSHLQSKRFSSSSNVPPKTRSTDNEFGRAKHQVDNKKSFRH